MVLLNMGEILKVHARKHPKKMALKDWRGKALTYPELASRTNKLANGLLDMGLGKGDRVAVMLYNCAEFIETICGLAKIGVVGAPVSWRYIGKEIEYVVDNSDARAMIVGEDFVDTVNSIRSNFKKINRNNYVVVGQATPEGYVNYETLIAESSENIPNVKVDAKDTWLQILSLIHI